MIDALSEKRPKVADHLDAARSDLLAFTAFPKQIWRQIRSNNPAATTPPLPNRIGSEGDTRGIDRITDPEEVRDDLVHSRGLGPP